MIFASVLSIERRQDDQKNLDSRSDSKLKQSKTKTRVKRERWYQDEENDFIDEKMNEWRIQNFKNIDLWEQFKNDFVDWTNENFRTATIEKLREFRVYLRQHDVWVRRQRDTSINKVLFAVIQKETKTSWIEEEVMNCLNEDFKSNIIKLLLETNFDRNLKNYSWQAKSRFESRRPRNSSTRERSTLRRSILERSILKKSIISEKEQLTKKDY